MKRHLFSLFLTLSFIALILSCNKQQDNVDLKTGFLSFLVEKQDVIGYGVADLNSILQKSDLANLPIDGFDIKDYYTKITSSIDVKEKIYVALEGPFINEQPQITYLFMSVKSRSDLQQSLQDLGFFFGKNQGVEVFSSDKIALGFNAHKLVIAFGEATAIANVKMKEIIEGLNRATLNESKDYMLEAKTDLLLIAELENIQKLYPDFISEIPQQELSEIVEGGKFILKADFEAGKMVGELDFSNVNNKLKEVFLLRENGSREVMEKITKYPNDLELMVNFESDKLDDLLNKYAIPKRKITRSLGLPGMMIEAIVDDSISNLTNGEIGVGMINESVNVMDIINLPKMRMYMGLGKKSNEINALFETFVKIGMMGKYGGNTYRYNDTKFQVDPKSLLLDTRSVSQQETFKIEGIPAYSKTDSINNAPFFMVIRPQKFPSFIEEYKEFERIFNLTALIKVTGDNKAFSFEVIFKEPEGNALKQVLMSYF